MTDRLPVFRAEYRRLGTLDATPIYHVARDAKHAKKLIRDALTRQLKGSDFELSEVVECHSTELPDDERLFAELHRQREQLRPPAPTTETGNFWLFRVSVNGGAPQRLWVYCGGDKSAARAKAESRIAEKLELAEVLADEATPIPNIELLPQVERLTTDQAVDRIGKRQTGIMSVLIDEDRRLFVADLQAEYKQTVIKHLEATLKAVRKAEGTPKIPAPPKPSRLLVDCENFVKQQSIDSESGLSTRGRLVGAV